MSGQVNLVSRFFAGMGFWFAPRRILSLALSATLVLNGPFGVMVSAQAQIISDPRAPIQFQPRVGAAPNGVPLIDITKPSFGGLSHNKYDQYNVDTRGVILNNSGLGGTSILGGQIAGNPNLAGSRPASVILNEVTGTSASLLNGPTEVFGSKAEVIVANPNGVTCRSCSFINTGRVTLSSGVPIPDYQNGTVGFAVTRGKVIIEGGGVAAINPDGTIGKIGDLDLVGRQIEINGPINAAGHMRLRSGAINWNQNSDLATRLDGAPAINGFGISSSAAGVIQAGTISAISYDLNVGVSFAGDLTALGVVTPDGRGGNVQLAGLIAVTSAGNLALGNLGSTGDIRLEADGSLTLTKNNQALGRITGFGKTITIETGSQLVANDAIVFEAVQDLITKGYLQSGAAVSLVGGGNAIASGKIVASGMVNLEGVDVSAADLQVSGQTITIAGLGNVALDKTILVARDRVAVLGNDMRLGEGTAFQAGENNNGQIFIDARGDLTNATVLNYPNLTLNLGRSLINEASGQIVFDNLRLVLSDNIINAGLIYGRVSSIIEAQALENRAGGTIYGPEVTISVAQNLINAGKILSEGKLAITALGHLTNDGAIQATGDLTLRAASYAAHSADAILAGAKAELILSGALDNAGKIIGNAGVAITAASLANRASATLYGDGTLRLALTGDLDNTGKILASDDLTITAAHVINNGALQTNGDLSVTANSYTANGVNAVAGADNITFTLTGGFNNAGRLVANDLLTLSAQSLSNQAGSALEGFDVMLALTGDAANAGTIAAQNILNLSAVNLTNSGKLTAYEISRLSGSDLTAGLVLSGALNNSGVVQTTNNLLMQAAALWNGSGATIQAKALSALIAGDIGNNGAIIADGNLILAAANLTNSGTASHNATISGKALEARIGNAINNGAYGLVQGIDRTVLSANTATLDLFHVNTLDQGIFNFGKDFALTLRNQGLTINDNQSLIVDGSLYLSLSGDVTVLGVLASREDLSLHSGGSVIIGRNDPTNPGGGEVFTRGNAEIIAASNIENYASIIQSLGSMYLEVGGSLINTRTEQWRSPVTIIRPSPSMIPIVGDEADRFNEFHVTYSETSDAAMIAAGGDLVIKAGTVINDASMISAGNKMQITADAVYNTSRDTGVWRAVTNIDTSVEVVALRGFIPETHEENTALIYAAGEAVVIVAPTQNNTGRIDAPLVVINAKTLVNGITDPNRTTAPSRLPDPVIDLSHYFNGPGAGGFGRPGSTPVVINGVKYIHAAPLAGENERGPSWILEQVGDIRNNLAFFADPTTEQRMLQQAILDQTGRGTLDPKYRNPAEQQEALWQATIGFLKANPDVKLGDTLTAEQRASITEPILWYVAQTIDGESVLVPQLVLPEGQLEQWRKANGGVIAGNDVYLTGDSIHNTGAILAEGTLSITADTFTNERRVVTYVGENSTNSMQFVQDGGLLAGDIVQIKTTGDLINIGGTMIADSALNLVAGGDLILTAAVAETSVHMGGKKHSADLEMTQNYGGTVYSGGDMSLYAGNDIVVAGSSVIALGDASILAGGAITVTSVVDEYSLEQRGKSGNIISKKSWTSSDNTSTNVSSLIMAGGDLTVAAAGNVNIHASDLIAGDAMRIAAGAGANGDPNASVTITAGQDSAQHGYSQTKSGLFGGGDGWADIWHKKTITQDSTTITNAGSSLTAGGDITITANADINIQGSSIAAGGTAALDAGRDINITPGYDGTSDYYKKEEKGLGFRHEVHDSQYKYQEGYHKQSDEYSLATGSVVPSVIQGGTGVTMKAGNDINLQAAIISTPGDISLTAGHDINAGVAYDTMSSFSKHDELFIGATVKASQNVTDIISNMRSAADMFNSGHGNSAYEAIGQISGVMKAADAIWQASQGPRVSVSATVGGEGRSISSNSDTALAHGTVLNAGGNLTLNAGNDVHLIGTQAHAGNDLSITAGHDVIIESAQSYSASGSKDESWNAGVGVGASAGLGGYSVGIQIEGGYANSTNQSRGTQQNNAHLTADGSVSIKSGNDTTLAGAVIYAPEVNLDVGNNLTIESRQDTAHSDGSAIRGGGSLTIGYGVAVSAYGGGGSSESDVAWVTEQTGIYADGKINIRVENHTQLNGGAINSGTGDLTLDTGTLGFTDIKDHDRGSAFDMTAGASFGTQQDTPWSWLTGPESSGSASSNNQANSSNPQTGLPTGPWVGGSIENHEREQDTNATIGAGTITIRNQDAQQQDVASLNRDMSQAQVITKDETSGVNFYVSGNGLNAITNPLMYSQQIAANYVRQFDQLAAMGNNLAAQLREAARNGTFNEETVNQLRGCSDGGGQQGWNILDLFVTKAHAANGCLIFVGGEWKEFSVKDARECYRIANELMREANLAYVDNRVAYFIKTRDDGSGMGAAFRGETAFGRNQIIGGSQFPVQYSENGGAYNPLQVQWNGTIQYLYSNPQTGAAELYNPNYPYQYSSTAGVQIPAGANGGSMYLPPGAGVAPIASPMLQDIRDINEGSIKLIVGAATIFIPVGGGGSRAVVTAEARVGGSVFIDVNQTARAAYLADANQLTLIGDQVAARAAQTGKALPNGNMATAHAEIGAMQQAYNAGLTQGADMTMIVSGQRICTYCKSNIASMAEASGLNSLTIREVSSGSTLSWITGGKLK